MNADSKEAATEKSSRRPKFIDRIAVADLFSFGPQQILDDVARFNLLIGQNGSGKTNLLKILGHRYKDGVLPDDWANSDRRHILSTTGSPCGELRITLGVRRLTFEHGELTEGNPSAFSKRVKHVSVWNDKASVAKELEQLDQQLTGRIKYLDFSLFYIFQRGIGFDSGGGVVESNRRGPIKLSDDPYGTKRLDYRAVGEGASRAARILIEVLLADESAIVLIDEPEVGLEAGAIRRLHEILVWLASGCQQFDESCNGISQIRNRVQSQWLDWDTTHRDSVSLVEGNAIQIPSVPLAPKQLFVSSHSSVLVNEFMELGEAGAIFKFQRSWLDNSHDVNWKTIRACENDEFARFVLENHQEIEQQFTKIERIHNSAHSLLDELGCRGADLLQANGVVWVEGPSDIVFINKWIEMYCEANKTSLKKGRDYEFQMFGGTLLDSICLICEGLNEDVTYRKLVEMFSFSRNAFVIIDSDAVRKEDGSIFDKSKFRNAKRVISGQIETLKNKGYRLGLWFEEGNTQIRTLEDYLDDDSIQQHYKQCDSGMTKKRYAQLVTESWGNGKRLSEFPHSLEAKIEDLVSVIRSWNDSRMLSMSAKGLADER